MSQRKSFGASDLFIYLIEMKATFLFTVLLTIMRVQGFSPVSTSSRKIRPQYSFHERKPISSVRLFPTNMISATSSSIAKLSVIPQSISFLHQDYMFVLSSLLIMSTFGIFLERKTTIGKSLSAPLATMALSLIAANLGIVPFSSPVYEFINRYLVTLAVPMLLFDSNMYRVISFTGPLLKAFFLGSVATIVGTFIAFPLVPLRALGSDQAWKVAAALAARHIGGAINFVAVCESFNVAGSVVSAAIAADNLVIAIYFAFLFYLGKPGESEIASQPMELSASDQTPTDPENVTDDETSSSSMSMMSVATSITVSSCIVTLSKVLSKFILPSGISSLPLISVITVLGATVFTSFFGKLRTSGTGLGVFFMQLFFAASGAAGSIALVLKSAPSLFLFSVLQIVIHFLVLMGLGKVFRVDLKNLLLSSNANIGGPTTAAAMAQAKDWNRLVVPALLVGILGYAIATPIGLIIGPFLARI